MDISATLQTLVSTHGYAGVLAALAKLAGDKPPRARIATVGGPESTSRLPKPILAAIAAQSSQKLRFRLERFARDAVRGGKTGSELVEAIRAGVARFTDWQPTDLDLQEKAFRDLVEDGEGVVGDLNRAVAAGAKLPGPIVGKKRWAVSFHHTADGKKAQAPLDTVIVEAASNTEAGNVAISDYNVQANLIHRIDEAPEARVSPKPEPVSREKRIEQLKGEAHAVLPALGKEIEKTAKAAAGAAHEAAKEAVKEVREKASAAGMLPGQVPTPKSGPRAKAEPPAAKRWSVVYGKGKKRATVIVEAATEKEAGEKAAKDGVPSNLIVAIVEDKIVAQAPISKAKKAAPAKLMRRFAV